MLEGIDVASFDDPLDPAKIKAAGKSFVFVKATGGTGYTNPNYHRDVQLLAAAHEIEGGYLFQSERGSASSGGAEFKHFADVAGDLTGQLRCVLDVETARSDIHRWTVDAVAACLDVYAFLPIIYGSPGNLDGWLNDDADLAECPYWGAHYTDAPQPWICRPWSTQHKPWTFWQYASTGGVPGVTAHDVDHDRFNGTIDDLRRLIVGYAKPEQEPDMITVTPGQVVPLALRGAAGRILLSCDQASTVRLAFGKQGGVDYISPRDANQVEREPVGHISQVAHKFAAGVVWGSVHNLGAQPVSVTIDYS